MSSKDNKKKVNKDKIKSPEKVRLLMLLFIDFKIISSA